jgi:hypothetical protein
MNGSSVSEFRVRPSGNGDVVTLSDHGLTITHGKV